LGVGAFGHGVDLIDLQLRLVVEQHVHRVEGGIHRAIAGGVGGFFHPVDHQSQFRFARAFGAADHAQAFDLNVVVFLHRGLIGHQRHQILVVDLFLAVGQSLEAHEDVVQLVVGQLVSQLFQLGPQRGTARVFAHGDVLGVQANIGGAHDFKRLDVLQHAILMDAGFMQEGVLADDGLVELHRKAGNGGHTARQVHDLGGVDLGAVGHDVVADLHGHHDLFQRGVARAFAQPVDRAFDLARACVHGSQGVGGGHAQIVVAMRGEDHLVGSRHAVQQHGDQIGGFARGGVAHGIGNVDRGRPRLDGDFDGAAEIIMLGAGRVHRGPLHVVTQVARMGHGVVDALSHLVHGQVRNGAVQRRGADEGVDARRGGVFHRLPAAINVFVIGAGQTADRRVFRAFGNLGHGGEIALGRNRETGLDHIDAHFVQEAGDLQLFVMGHGGAGGLFPVAQGGVKNDDARLRGFVGHVVLPWCFASCLRALSTSERSRPMARSEAGKKKQPTGSQRAKRDLGEVDVRFPCHEVGLYGGIS
jgi:hypothetical protein